MIESAYVWLRPLAVGTAVLLIAPLLARFLPSSRTRYAVGGWALLAGVSAPLWCVLADSVGATSVRVPILPPQPRIAEVSVNPPPPAPDADHEGPERTPLWVGAVYMAGGLLLLARLVHGRVKIRAVIGATTTAVDDRVGSEVSRLAAAMRVDTIDLRTGDPSCLPFLVAGREPVIVVPEGLADRLEPDELRAVLAHELAHVRFRHLATAALERTCQILAWPHPLVHLLIRDMAAWREEVCDDVAADATTVHAYTRALLKVAECAIRPPTTSLALFASRRTLRRRVQRLLHEPRRSVKLMPVSFVSSLAALAGLSALGAGARLAPQSVPSEPPTVRTARPAVATPGVATVAPVSPARQAPPAPLATARARGVDGKDYIVTVVTTKKGKLRGRVRVAGVSTSPVVSPSIEAGAAQPARTGVPVTLEAAKEAHSVTTRSDTPAAVRSTASTETPIVARVVQGFPAKVADLPGARPEAQVAAPVVVQGNATTVYAPTVSVPGRAMPAVKTTTVWAAPGEPTPARAQGVRPGQGNGTEDLAARIDRLIGELEQIRSTLRNRTTTRTTPADAAIATRGRPVAPASTVKAARSATRRPSTAPFKAGPAVSPTRR
ncbi:MAG: M48 family metalloprotease [Fimbriimonadaceae bacterium]|nr:M48 family metalloprotease [Fimbriimonadaceae bacterium]